MVVVVRMIIMTSGTHGCCLYGSNNVTGCNNGNTHATQILLLLDDTAVLVIVLLVCLLLLVLVSAISTHCSSSLSSQMIPMNHVSRPPEVTMNLLLCMVPGCSSWNGNDCLYGMTAVALFACLSLCTTHTHTQRQTQTNTTTTTNAKKQILSSLSQEETTI